jgi:cytochrome c553
MTTNRFVAGLIAGLIASSAAVAADGKIVSKTKVNLDERLAEIMKDPKTVETATKMGRRVASFCANCHGDSGNSSRPDVPNLAGQNPAYLLEQVRKFVDGRRRDEFMQGMIKALSDEEKVAAVVFFSHQEVIPHESSNKELVSKGRGLFYKICWRCHGEQGRGNDKIARIAGQQPEYLARTLKRYRDRTGERIDPFMAANTEHLTDADISAVVAFVSGMK